MGHGLQSGTRRETMSARGHGKRRRKGLIAGKSWGRQRIRLTWAAWRRGKNLQKVKFRGGLVPRHRPGRRALVGGEDPN